MNRIRFRFVTIRSMVEAPAKIKQIFTSSDGWNEMPPREIQFFAPNFSVPKTKLNSSSATPAAAAI